MLNRIALRETNPGVRCQPVKAKSIDWRTAHWPALIPWDFRRPSSGGAHAVARCGPPVKVTIDLAASSLRMRRLAIPAPQKSGYCH
jgi:hypothetical protein